MVNFVFLFLIYELHQLFLCQLVNLIKKQSIFNLTKESLILVCWFHTWLVRWLVLFFGSVFHIYLNVVFFYGIEYRFYFWMAIKPFYIDITIATNSFLDLFFL